jgi:transcriptional regulator with XRE-family HTH domain
MNQQIKLARIRAGLTQQELANIAGVPENYISKLETGRIQVSAEIIHAFRRYLSLPKSDLFANDFWVQPVQDQGGEP